MANVKNNVTKTLTLTPYRLPRRGRGGEIIAQAIGDVIVGEKGDTIHTEGLRGYPINLLMAFCRQQNIDASLALAEGINAILANQARQSSPAFDLQRRIVDEHIVDNDQDARFAALYVRQLAKRTNIDPGDVIDALKVLHKAS